MKPPLPPLQPPGAGVVEHCASFGRWFIGTRPIEPLEDPPLELPPEDPLPPPLLLLLEDAPPEEGEPPPLELPSELLDELLPSLPASLPGEPRTRPPQAPRNASEEAAKASARRMIDPPIAGRSPSNCGATRPHGFRGGRS
jgi:hypothetical protein